MAVKKKKIGAAGRFGAGYGKVKQRLIDIEKKQRKKQECPFCKGIAKRQASGIWLCKKCKKKFASDAYHL
jgi:ribosomal protein L37AE/L43A